MRVEPFFDIVRIKDRKAIEIKLRPPGDGRLGLFVLETPQPGTDIGAAGHSLGDARHAPRIKEDVGKFDGLRFW